MGSYFIMILHKALVSVSPYHLNSFCIILNIHKVIFYQQQKFTSVLAWYFGVFTNILKKVTDLDINISVNNIDVFYFYYSPYI